MLNGHNLCNLLPNGSEQKYNDMYVYMFLREKEETWHNVNSG